MPIALLHLDESCLGNGREGENPGGTGGLIEVRGRRGIERRDFFLSEPATTNNRMALRGAAEALRILGGKGARLQAILVSDSQYLVRGIVEWVPGWIARGWRRRTGPIENLALWQQLVEEARKHDVRWRWVRGHAGHPKNEYANDLAIRAAERQEHSGGAVPSAFGEWLAARQRRGLFEGYDPDAEYERDVG